MLSGGRLIRPEKQLISDIATIGAIQSRVGRDIGSRVGKEFLGSFMMHDIPVTGAN